MLIKDQVLSEIKSQRYTIKFAKTHEEVEAALQLRYKVFNEELKRGFEDKSGMEMDRYDEQSHHLIVIDNASDTIVGTYRMQTYDQALAGNGFSSEVRFQINQLPLHVLENAVEVGRACISKQHRSGRVLFLLWKGFAGYLEHFGKRYLFGYAALNTDNFAIALSTYNYLKENGDLHPDFYIEPKREYKLNLNNIVEKSEEIDIPPLFRNYLDVGSKVIAGPSYDRTFNLIHFMILLDVEEISERTRRMFFG